MLDRARRLFPQLDQQESLSSHKTIAAAALVMPSDESGMDLRLLDVSCGCWRRQHGRNLCVEMPTLLILEREEFSM